ncbi:hypothetical protein JCM10914A_02350 [Paenibacillus sp. JCM 10914]|uniref:hypothetical protein n=1 Tax=Paenibacillus sp. JCM 10914 TaxID=1236974 RepID=UPI0003CC6551|nr:hypothetical protein [Paenibacillus sp. JCM 10914]GAE06834.1 hypothetical protein JCM10914_3019 [Paenibacillus sp. JCM 10914]
MKNGKKDGLWYRGDGYRRWSWVDDSVEEVDNLTKQEMNRDPAEDRTYPGPSPLEIGYGGVRS